MLVRSLPLLASGLALLVTALPVAAQVYSWSWVTEEAEYYNPAGGAVNWIETSYDVSSQTLSWTANFGEVPGHPGVVTDVFTLALNDGFLPAGISGEMAHLYFDATGDDVHLNVFGYNGDPDVTSHTDGSSDPGVQDPDRILSSLVDSSWIYDTTAVNEVDGTRTLGFTIDATAINDHDPLYPGDAPWVGAQFGEAIGIWFHPIVAGDELAYVDGYLAPGTTFAHQGWFDITSTDTEPVPEPSTLALLGLGLAGLAARRRRRRR